MNEPKTADQPRFGRGGDITLIPGSGEIVFRLASGEKVLRFNHDGTVLVHGEKVDDNAIVYASLRHWLSAVLRPCSD